MKEQIKTITEDIDLVLQAIYNRDLEDAIQMLKDIQEDLKIISLIS